MSKIRVLIVDDSSFMRLAMRGFLSRDPEIEVVGVAVDGADGVAKAAQLLPDVITMDVEMPIMDGITAVRRIMATAPTRVIMVSTLTGAGATATFEALEAGAIDYVPKNATDSPGVLEQFRTELLRKIKEAAYASFGRKNSVSHAPVVVPATERIASATPSRRIKYIGIGASTGGPMAVREVLTRLPAAFPHAIMVAIHMPQAFTGPYAEQLNSKCLLQVKEAVDGDILRPGQVLIAPGGKHSILVRRPEGIVVHLFPNSDYPRYFYIPSVDLMLSSLVESAGGPVLGVILTGMGNDGLKGMQQLKGRGGIAVVQDESTSTIFGMPRACIEEGLADEILPLGQIGAAICQLTAV
jgi:two-component system chemotaxis response regulator CheB